MFCEKCGTRVDDGQPFCPNCGNRLGAAAPAQNPGFNANPIRPSAAPAGSLLGKFNGMSGLEKIFYPIVGGLLLLNFILILLPIYKVYSTSLAMGRGYPFWANLFTILFTLSITFFVLDYFDKFNFKFLRLFLVIVSALLLILFIILWADSDCKLSVAGWFFFILQIGLTGCSVMLLLSKHIKI